MPAALVTRSFARCWSMLGCGLFPLLGLAVWVGKTLESPPCLRTQSPGRPLKAPFKWAYDYPASQSIGSLFVGCPLCGVHSMWVHSLWGPLCVSSLCMGFTLCGVHSVGCPLHGVPFSWGALAIAPLMSPGLPCATYLTVLGWAPAVIMRS